MQRLLFVILVAHVSNKEMRRIEIDHLSMIRAKFLKFFVDGFNGGPEVISLLGFLHRVYLGVCMEE